MPEAPQKETNRRLSYPELIEGAIAESQTFSRWENEPQMKEAMSFVRQQFIKLEGEIKQCALRSIPPVLMFKSEYSDVSHVLVAALNDFLQAVKFHNSQGEWLVEKITPQSISKAWRTAVVYLRDGILSGRSRRQTKSFRQRKTLPIVGSGRQRPGHSGGDAAHTQMLEEGTSD